MKVILRADVEKLGSLGDLVEVKAGYGRNYLLPQGLAMLATPANLKVFELERKKLQEKTAALRAEAAKIADSIAAVLVTIPMRVGENDKLYGSVTAGMIVDALVEHNIHVDRRKVLLDSPIRTLGEYQVRIRLHAGVQAPLTVRIVSDRAVHTEEVTETVESQENVENNSSAE